MCGSRHTETLHTKPESHKKTLEKTIELTSAGEDVGEAVARGVMTSGFERFACLDVPWVAATLRGVVDKPHLHQKD